MEPFIIFSFIISSLVFVTACSTLIKSKASKTLPPGPPKLPILGNIHHFIGPEGPHRVLKTLARKYGPIMYLQLGQVPTLVVSTPRLAQEVLKTHDAIFADRPITEASEVFVYKAQDIVWAPYGSYWKQMRKVFTMQLFSPKRVQSYSFIRDEELTNMRKSLKSSAQKPTILREILVKYVNDVICRYTIGDIHKDQTELIEVLFEILKGVVQFNVASYYPSMRFINAITGKKAKWLKIQKQLDNILEDILEQHSNNRASGSQDQEDLVDVLLRVKEAANLDLPITNDNVKAVVLDMLVAGTSDSSIMLEWVMGELMKNPSIMKIAQEEIREIVNGNTITDADIQNMHYLKMIVKETMRLHGPPLLIPRISRRACVVDGYDIPANTRILVNALACATDPDSWEDPERFIPERFENSSINYSGTHFEFIPFGSGRRVCPGINFGIGIIENALATLLYHFDWELPHGLKSHELDLTEDTVLSTLPKHPIEVVPIIMSQET